MLQPGEIINDTYRVELLLGRGGTAHVYEVSHLRLPRRFALKVIVVEHGRDPEFQKRFRQEAEILASLDHPHLVQVIDWNLLPNQQPYLVMELLAGEDLSKFLSRVGALSLPIALRIFVQIADALELAHENGIVHRDLKPANIFLCRNGSASLFVKVLDFGIAKSVRCPAPLQTDRRTLMGTPGYMAPEQISSSLSEINARTDQWALAAILHEMLTGRPTFYRPREEMMVTLMRVLTEDAEPLPLPQLDLVIRRALSKDPSARFASVAEFVEATGATELESTSRLVPRTQRIIGTLEQVTNAVTVVSKEGVPPPSAERNPPSVKGQQIDEQPPRGRQRWRVGISLLGGWLLVFLPVAFWLRPVSWRRAAQVVSASTDLASPQEDFASWAGPPDSGAEVIDLGIVDLSDGVSADSSVKTPSEGRLPRSHLVKRRDYTVRVAGLPDAMRVQQQFIVKCVKETFCSAMRQFVGVKILLSRSRSLCVVSDIPAAYAVQLGQCLDAMPQPIPESASFVIGTEPR